MRAKTAKKKASSNPYLPKAYTVLDYTTESPDTFTITIAMAVTHAPGQFVQVSMPGIGEAPISIASFSDKTMKLTIRRIGNVTEALSKLKKGDKVYVRGPYGNGYPMQELKGNDLVIIGGGCGVAPLKGIIDYVEHHRTDFGHVYLFVGYRSPKDILFAKDIEDWRKRYNLEVTVDKNPSGEFCYDGKTGFITEAVKQAPFDNKNKVVFICGPPVMTDAVIKILEDKGFHDDQIFISAERMMYCALGACCHCMIRDKYTCVDGPVFRYDEIRGYKTD